MISHNTDQTTEFHRQTHEINRKTSKKGNVQLTRLKLLVQLVWSHHRAWTLTPTLVSRAALTENAHTRTHVAIKINLLPNWRTNPTVSDPLFTFFGLLCCRNVLMVDTHYRKLGTNTGFNKAVCTNVFVSGINQWHNFMYLMWSMISLYENSAPTR